MSLDQQMLKIVKRQFAADCGIEVSNGRIGQSPDIEKAFLSDESYGEAVRDELQQRTGIRPRIYEGISPFFRCMIMGQEIWIMADEKIMGWCREEFSDRRKGAEWLGQFSELNRLNRMLWRFRHEIVDCRICMLPDCGNKDVKTWLQEPPVFSVRFLDSGEILDIRDPYPFRHALCDSALMPCEMAVAAFCGGRIVGMAGATGDCDTMWQIGVDVLPEWEGKGIGSHLVRCLKEKILELGKIPFYSTAQSHVASVNTALKAGFVPAWVEIFVK